MEEAPAVLDLNVLLAAILKPTGPTAAAILALYLAGVRLYTPDYLREEFARKARELEEKKHLQPGALEKDLENILSLTVEARWEEYRGLLEEAKTLVKDPRDTPYAALALHLASHHGKAILITYNKSDFLDQDLAKRGVIVATPREALRYYLGKTQE